MEYLYYLCSVVEEKGKMMELEKTGGRRVHLNE